ncbi:serine hydrolase FSH [Aspergillus karnatakaensis]|uniref:serine hydrolase FSH n=1 Tax=Aspergillus karnatakaensis TaxID=1810916 RepID=UPI003CCD85D0
MPKILCLHGHGTSAAIFKSQTASFRAHLPSRYTFTFIDAPHPSAPAPGIKAIYPDYPTYTWFSEATPTGVRAAHAWVREYCRRHGPFDAVCGFSQGCSLIASLCLFDAFERTNKTNRGENGFGYGNGEEGSLPFRAAIFICGGIPLYALESISLPILPHANSINTTTGALLNGTASKLSTYAKNTSLIKRGSSLWDGNDDVLLHDTTKRPDRSDVFGLDFTSFPSWAAIDIPTVHVVGGRDPRWPAGIQLAEFCDDRMEFDHGGGHDIPRTSEVSERIAQLVQGVVERI